MIVYKNLSNFRTLSVNANDFSIPWQYRESSFIPLYFLWEVSYPCFLCYIIYGYMH